MQPDTKAIGFITAIFIPGVITYSLALFFVKFVNYVFMYWLPKFIHNTTSFTASESANISIFFDLGGILGGITAGVLNDKFGKPANTCFWMLVTSVPMVSFTISLLFLTKLLIRFLMQCNYDNISYMLV